MDDFNILGDVKEELNKIFNENNKIQTLRTLKDYQDQIQKLIKNNTIKSLDDNQLILAEAFCYSFQQFLTGMTVDNIVVYRIEYEYDNSGQLVTHDYTKKRTPYRYQVSLGQFLKDSVGSSPINSLTKLTKAITNDSGLDKYEKFLNDHFNTQILPGFQKANTNKTLSIVKKQIRDQYTNNRRLYQKGNKPQVFNKGHIIEAFERAMQVIIPQLEKNEISESSIVSNVNEFKSNLQDQYFGRSLYRDSTITYRQGDVNFSQVKYQNAQMLKRQRVRRRLMEINSIITTMTQSLKSSGPASLITNEKITTELQNFLPTREDIQKTAIDFVKELINNNLIQSVGNKT